MVKIALLAPRDEMLEAAKKIIEEQKIEVAYMKAIRTVDAVREARNAVEAGAHIVVARGYQAKLIKEYTNIPLVEMRFHAQEIGLLIAKAKAIVKKPHPVIGLIAFDNMLSDLSHMADLLDVELHIAYIEKMEDATAELMKMSVYHPDIIIGGEITCDAAEKMGYPTLFYTSTEESVAEALLAARRMAYAAETEKQNTAQFETVLDTSFNGIIKLNTEGRIIVINKLVENLIGKNAEDVIGILAADVFPMFDTQAIDSILTGRRESYTTSVNLRDQAWMLMMAPIQYDDQITGAILSLQKVSDTIRRDQRLQRDMFLHGFVAQTSFQDIDTESQEMKKALNTAREYALSDSPVLLYGEEGTEYYRIAEAIHNNSPRRSGPFVSVSIGSMEAQEQMEALFGSSGQDRKNGALIRANHGTIFIKEIERLTLKVQYQICKALLADSAARTDAQLMENLDVRVIAFSRENLRILTKKGAFGEELFYLLQGLTLQVPSLNDRPEDLHHYFLRYFREYMRKYNKHLSLTEGAKDCIGHLSWQGNLLQLRAFCERLVITSQKRSVDEVRIQKLYSELYPLVSEAPKGGSVVVYQSEEAARLGALLEKHHGNRALVAQELGISTTTLWRRMKKYGIEANYGQS